MTWRNKAYLHDWVPQFVCCVCGESNTVAAHVGGNGTKGMSCKVPDYQTAPLCQTCHDRLDGRALPPLDQAERERVFWGMVECAGQFIADRLDSEVKRRRKFGQRKPGSRASQSPRLKMGERRRREG